MVTHAHVAVIKNTRYTSRSNTEINGPWGGERNAPIQQQASGVGQDRGDQRLITDEEEEASLIPTIISLCHSARRDVCTHLTQRPSNRSNDHEHNGDPRRERASDNGLQTRPSKVRRDPCKARWESELSFRWRRIFFLLFVDGVAARRAHIGGIGVMTLQFLLWFGSDLVAPTRVVGGLVCLHAGRGLGSGREQAGGGWGVGS